jgi:hypothetical protein
LNGNPTHFRLAADGTPWCHRSRNSECSRAGRIGSCPSICGGKVASRPAPPPRSSRPFETPADGTR